MTCIHITSSTCSANNAFNAVRETIPKALQTMMPGMIRAKQYTINPYSKATAKAQLFDHITPPSDIGITEEVHLGFVRPSAA
ncbi:hypothetical protein BTUL_0185g00230 [Botrytis tulipae]|uniref:Uncharacterized protein n=1 Tax=Botrytis tulipae TaxID=87230 RepID=A0A4Z1E9W0_9HELO|nr:hypothetical protein BTUL_0185g00230 [Botrytis tulipae]